MLMWMPCLGLKKRQIENVFRCNEERRLLGLFSSRDTEADNFAMMVGLFLCLSGTALS